MESVDESVEVTAFDTFSSTSTLEALDPSPSSPPSHGEVAPDFGIEKESTSPQQVKLKDHRGRGRPRRQASNMPQEEVAVTESKRKLRKRKNAELASEDPWTNLSKAPLLTPLSPKKPRQARALQKSQPPVNWIPLPLHAFH